MGSTSEPGNRQGRARNLNERTHCLLPMRPLPPIAALFRGQDTVIEAKGGPCENNQSLTNGVSASCIPLGLTAH